MIARRATLEDASAVGAVIVGSGMQTREVRGGRFAHVADCDSIRRDS